MNKDYQKLQKISATLQYAGEPGWLQMAKNWLKTETQTNLADENCPGMARRAALSQLAVRLYWSLDINQQPQWQCVSTVLKKGHI